MKLLARLDAVVPTRDTCALLLPSTLTILVACIFVVVRPIAALSGQYAFLTVTIVYLYYFPSGPLISQLESACLVFVGALFSLGYINLFLYFAVLANRPTGTDTAQGRAASGVGLALLAFVTGYIRSRSPRLTGSARIMLFLAIFALTENPALTQMTITTFLELFYPTLFAGCISLTCSTISQWLLPVYRPSLRALTQDVLCGLDEAVRAHAAAIATMIGGNVQLSSESSGSSQVTFDSLDVAEVSATKPASVLHSIILLRRLWEEEGHTISISCLPATALQPVVDLLQDRIARNPMNRPALAPFAGEEVPSDMSEAPTVPLRPILGKELRTAASLAASSAVIGARVRQALLHIYLGLADAYGWKAAQSKGFSSGKSRRLSFTLTQTVDCRIQLDAAIEQFERALIPWAERDLFEREAPLDITFRNNLTASANRRMTPQRVRSQLAFAMIALLDMAKDISRLLILVQQQIILADQVAPRKQRSRQRRINVPRLNWGWLSVRPHATGWEGEHSQLDVIDTDNSQEAEAGIAEAAEYREVLTRIVSPQRHLDHSAPTQTTLMAQKSTVMAFIEHSWRRYWDAPRTLRKRVSLSKKLSSIKHSRHLQYSFKMAFGVSLLSLPAFLPQGSSGQAWFSQARAQWMVISYMYVLDTITGGTLRIGFFRLLGTIFGAILGHICYLIAKRNPYGLVVLGTACNLPIAYSMLRTSYPGIGIVAGITLPPILFIPYLGTENDNSPIDVALLRGQDVAIGIVAAILVGSFVFPAHARKRYKEIAAKTLDELALMYLAMSKDLLRASFHHHQTAFNLADRRVEARIAQCRNYAVLQHSEVSLLPKPHVLHMRLNAVLQRIFELFIEIRLLRAGLPRKEAVLQVLTLRKDLVSAVFVSIYAVAHALRSNMPMPQFLPVPLEVLKDLGSAIDEHLRESRPASPADSSAGIYHINPPQLATLYAFAEREALTRLCKAIDELLSIARAMLGVQTFLSPPRT